MRILAATLIAALLAGCATTPPPPSGPPIDHTYTAHGQSSRARFLVLHYTVSNKADSIKILTQQEVSAHYLVTDDPAPVIYNLVDEKNAAWHAGNSSWKNFTQLNNSSIGIEIVNPGWQDTPSGRVYAPFTPAQIDALIPLVKDIMARNQIAPENVLGHSDIAPLRKQDPGPMFPWRRLADAGLITWPKADRVGAVLPVFQVQLPDVAWFQKKLATWGYTIVQSGTLDEQTRTVLAAFQMKYRPSNYDGNPDAESAALLEALTNPNGPLPSLVVPAPLETSPILMPPPPAGATAPAPAAPAAPPAPPVLPPTPALPPDAQH